MAAVDYAYLKEALLQGELVIARLHKYRDRVYVWGDDGATWAGVYRREEFITEEEARELRPELFI